MSASTIEKQIESYLSQLNASQKAAVLSVVKTIALAKQEYENIWDDKAFTDELEKRSASYENGTAKLLKFEDMKKTAISKYKGKMPAKK